MVNLITLKLFRNHLTPLTAIVLCLLGKHTSSNTGLLYSQLLFCRMLKTTECQSWKAAPGMSFWFSPFVLKGWERGKVMNSTFLIYSSQQSLGPRHTFISQMLKLPPREVNFLTWVQIQECFIPKPSLLIYWNHFLITISSRITFVIEIFSIILLSLLSFFHFIS